MIFVIFMIQDKAFENAIVKIQNGVENELTNSQRKIFEHLLKAKSSCEV